MSRPRVASALVAVVAVAVLGSSACGGGARTTTDPARAVGAGEPPAFVDVSPGAATDAIGEAPASVAVVAAPSTPTAVEAAPLEGAAVADAPVVVETPVPGAAERLSVEASATPTCAAAGDVIEVAIRTSPGATLGLAVAYADHQAHGAMGFGEAAADGTYVWRIPVAADAPAGAARALVGAELVADGGARRAGQAHVPFTVGRVGSCR